MTLSTDIFVHDQIDRDAVFAKCRELLGANDSHPFSDDPSWRGASGDDARCLANACGIGLPAWLMLHYRPDAPLVTAEQAAAHDEDCEADCDGSEHFAQACWLSVDFDTAYSYRDEQGRGCGDFHACLVATLGQWLDDRGVPWSWRNEFTGEVHGGDDRYERLTDLMQGGHRAMEWFQSTVKPAIAAHIRNGDAL